MIFGGSAMSAASRIQMGMSSSGIFMIKSLAKYPKNNYSGFEGNNIYHEFFGLPNIS